MAKKVGKSILGSQRNCYKLIFIYCALKQEKQDFSIKNLVFLALYAIIKITKFIFYRNFSSKNLSLIQYSTEFYVTKK